MSEELSTSSDFNKIQVYDFLGHKIPMRFFSDTIEQPHINNMQMQEFLRIENVNVASVICFSLHTTLFTVHKMNCIQYVHIDRFNQYAIRPERIGMVKVKHSQEKRKMSFRDSYILTK